MSYAPATLKAAMKVWTDHGGLNAGIVGSPTTHCRGYHLGKDRIYSQCACKPKNICRPGEYGFDYSMTLSRDRAGATNAAMALDLGPIHGSYQAMRAFAAWLVEQCRAGAADTRDIREIIYSRNDGTVWNWLRDRGETSLPERGGDATHVKHNHLSYYRDTEGRDKTAVFKRYFHAPVPPPQEADMTITDFVGQLWTPNASSTAQGRPYRDSPDRHGGKILGYVRPGERFLTSFEGSTPDGNDWRVGERVIGGDPRPVYYLRDDFDDVTKRGDPLDQEQHAYLAKTSA